MHDRAYCLMYNIAAREGKMVRMFLTVVAISFVAGTFPASAQGGGCEACVALTVAVVDICPVTRQNA